MSVIGVDVDGIVANFEKGYAPLLTQVSGITFPRLGDADWPDTWFWERAAGVTKEQEDKVWKELIIPADNFWFNLHAHAGAEDFLVKLWSMQKDHEIYFITSRVGKQVKMQTEDWLWSYGFDSATVLISGEKGACCKALKVTHYIDDKNENCLQVLSESPATKCYMLAKPYNSLEAITITSGNFGRIDSLKEFIDAIKG